MAKQVKQPEQAEPKNSVFGKKAQSLFAEYPEKETVYFTSDGLAFWLECDAINHAVSLKNNQVITINK